MNLSNSELLFIKNNINKVPLIALAKKFNMSTLEFCKLLRATSISPVIKDIELQYMKDCEESGVPPKKVKETLGITSSTQFSQICSRHGFKQLRGLQDITSEDAIKNTKWLIEDELKLEIDDFLPGIIKQDHFVKSGLSDCIRFANIEKKKHPYYKHFSAVTYLICNAYPENYRGYQFPHSKQNNYFKGSNGRHNYLYEIAWVIEHKMGLKLKDIDTYSSNNTFLRSKDLSFFGLGYHTFKHYYKSVEDIRKELVRIYGNRNVGANEKTEKLRLKLLEANIPFICAVEKCIHTNPQIHHIIPKRNKKLLQKNTIDYDGVDNLAFLCPNHHTIADELDCRPFLKVSSDKRKKMLLLILNEENKSSSK